MKTWGSECDDERVLTQSQGVINTEAAENLLDISGMKEPVSFHHHLEGF